MNRDEMRSGAHAVVQIALVLGALLACSNSTPEPPASPEESSPGESYSSPGDTSGEGSGSDESYGSSDGSMAGGAEPFVPMNSANDELMRQNEKMLEIMRSQQPGGAPASDPGSGGGNAPCPVPDAHPCCGASHGLPACKAGGAF